MSESSPQNPTKTLTHQEVRQMLDEVTSLEEKLEQAKRKISMRALFAFTRETIIAEGEISPAALDGKALIDKIDRWK